MVWIQSTHGAFSINVADTAPGSGTPDSAVLMIRARRRLHLQNLSAAFPTLADFSISETQGGDYRWRLVAPRSAVAEVAASLVLSIEHKNFKAACSARVADLGQDYIAALHKIWSTLAELQD